MMRNTHAWKTKTDDGEKREVRAEKFGKQWRIQSKLRGEDRWTYHESPELADLLELHDVLWRKYQRKRIAYDDLTAIELLIRERGGEAPRYD